VPPPADIQLPARHHAGLGDAISQGTLCERDARPEGEPFLFEKRDIVTAGDFNREGFIPGLRAHRAPPETVLALRVSFIFFLKCEPETVLQCLKEQEIGQKNKPHQPLHYFKQLTISCYSLI